jgi:hypothetical protein
VNRFSEGDEGDLRDQVGHDDQLRVEVNLADVIQQFADQELKFSLDCVGLLSVSQEKNYRKELENRFFKYDFKIPKQTVQP